MITSYEEAILMGVHPYLAAAAFIDTSGVFDAIRINKQIQKLKQMDKQTNTSYPAKTTGLDFTEAMAALADGFKTRLPEWTGYWFQRGKDIAVFSRTGDILDTPNWKHYAMREDWQIVTEGMGFDFALLALKAGKSVRESWWPFDIYLTAQIPDANSKMTVPYIYGTSIQHGVMPWLPDYIDLFSKDWEVINPTANLTKATDGSANVAVDMMFGNQKVTNIADSPNVSMGPMNTGAIPPLSQQPDQHL